MYSLHCYPMWANKEASRESTEEKQKSSEIPLIWRKLIKRWDPNDRKLVKCARSMTKYGPIPASLRGKAWFVMSGGAQLMASNHGLYQKLSSMPGCTPAMANLIAADLPRTMSGHNDKLPALGRVLTAYSNLDPSLGYCQGMNFIVALLLCELVDSRNHKYDLQFHCGEEEAFWTFVAIMRRVRSLFIDGLPGFHRVVALFSRLCREHLPKLHIAWQELGVDVYSLVLTPWMHSLFACTSSACLEGGHTQRIWDLFLAHDFRVIARVAFTMLASHQRKLRQMELSEVIDFCRYLPTMRRYGKQTVQKAMSLKLSDQYLTPMRDLTQFDWQLNKKLEAQYKEHLRKRRRKRMRMTKTADELKDEESDGDVEEEIESVADGDAELTLELNENESLESESHSQQLLGMLQGLRAQGMSARSRRADGDDSESMLSASISVSMSESSSVM